MNNVASNILEVDFSQTQSSPEFNAFKREIDYIVAEHRKDFSPNCYESATRVQPATPNKIRRHRKQGEQDIATLALNLATAEFNKRHWSLLKSYATTHGIPEGKNNEFAQARQYFADNFETARGAINQILKEGSYTLLEGPTLEENDPRMHSLIKANPHLCTAFMQDYVLVLPAKEKHIIRWGDRIDAPTNTVLVQPSYSGNQYTLREMLNE